MPSMRLLAAPWIAAALACASTASPGDDALPSWNEGPSRNAILASVEHVTRPGPPDVVPEAERIAVFDNDGTLWAEQPLGQAPRAEYLNRHDFLACEPHRHRSPPSEGPDPSAKVSASIGSIRGCARARVP